MMKIDSTAAASGNPVAEILEALMSKHRLNQTELAHRSGVSQPAINRILRERSKAKHPRQDTLEKLAAELGVTPDQLAGREPISAHMLARGVVRVLRWEQLLPTDSLGDCGQGAWLACPPTRRETAVRAGGWLAPSSTVTRPSPFPCSARR